MKPLAKLLKIPNRPILWLATLLHLAIGVGLILDGRVAFVTGLRALAEPQPELMGLLFIFSSMAALWALLRDAEQGPSLATFWPFIPQQMLLFFIAGGAVFAIIQGHYASGTVLPRSFIFIDQLPKLLLAALHPFGVFRMHVDILPKKVIDIDGD